MDGSGKKSNGTSRDRTSDLANFNRTLSQLSYRPTWDEYRRRERDHYLFWTTPRWCILQSIYFIPQHVIHNVKGLKATVLSGMWSCAAINPN
ncbi:hypothetical protein ACN38_g2075 [Penicillium nordicum]|uniref:Uncharacterized protein n=1 Tax=Penicillium nordicum TaxID=229535 RepID=A0A0M9WJA3_9EURO|nr:hypothetical protein ACN38_g2075 [Penicillium nordicum]